MDADEDRDILARARDLLKDLNADLQTAPEDLLPLIYGFAPRLEESIERFQEREISARELDAHTQQIRLSYLRDLTRLLATESLPAEGS